MKFLKLNAFFSRLFTWTTVGQILLLVPSVIVFILGNWYAPEWFDLDPSLIEFKVGMLIAVLLAFVATYYISKFFSRK